MYEELYKAWKKEKESLRLQPLPKDFYEKIAEYVRKIREESRMIDNKTTKGKLAKSEYENVKKMINELLRLRLEKILNSLSSGEEIPKNCLTREEEKIGEKSFLIVEKFEELAKNLLHGKVSAGASKKSRRKVVVRFLKDVPAIVGADLKTYGPFKVEDVASIPVENARVLVRQGLAVEVETD
ncbi:hypothetical protein DRO54_00035 [Candidatus Bathyarchaeota archaeon]|nr:MAG: hypothetical protein DRO54_00035 [Candidatus Bathyarchaeota archaeon]